MLRMNFKLQGKGTGVFGSVFLGPQAMERGSEWFSSMGRYLCGRCRDSWRLSLWSFVLVSSSLACYSEALNNADLELEQ